MGKEIITINVGGCGINLGTAALEQYCVEQGISFDGTKVKNNIESKEDDKNSSNPYEDTLSLMFRERSDGSYSARSLFVDMDPYQNSMARNIYKYSAVINKNYMVSGTKSSNNNWADAHYVGGKEIIDEINDRCRLSVEECDWNQGFIIHNSISGGTGGGLGSLILERLCVDYRKKCKFAFHSFMDENQLTSSIEVYNSLLSMHWLLDHTEISIMMDNRALYKLCRQKLDVKVYHHNYL